MRYILLVFVLSVAAVVAIAGKRGDISRQPPIELFPDMDRQPKLRPQTETRNLFWQDNLSSRLPVAGTVARNSPFELTPANTGRVPGTTNFVAINPMPITHQFLARGRDRYQISCAPCHGAVGDGKGVLSQYGMLPANLHDASVKKIVQQPDGELFHTISNGKGVMAGYASTIAIEDRWAIVAYVRVLQLSRLGALADIPAEHQAALMK
jgi:hypothetical protein